MNAKKKAHKKKVAQKKHADDKLDQALKDSFPSSDPIQLTEPSRNEDATDGDPTQRYEEEDQPSAPGP